MEPLIDVTFNISNKMMDNKHMAEYVIGHAKIDFINNINGMALAINSEKIAHELGHHFLWSRFKDWRFCNNGLHYCFNKNWPLITKKFRMGLTKSYKMSIYDLNYIINNRYDIENCCKSNVGKPQPYF